MPVVWSDRCLLHEPARELWIGLPMPATESPDRIERIRAALEGARFVEAEPHDDEILRRVHDEGLLRYLESAWEQWQSTGIPVEAGQDRVVPYVFPHPALGATLMEPTAVWARPGFYAYDTMTLIGPGTWEAARSAVDAALTAAEIVREGAPAAYACSRPPGHHACRSAYGGSCYLNNAACAALALRGRVAVIDIDAHHGNGTEQIFAGSTDVLVGSVHVDPRAGWFPHFLGFNGRNLPLGPGSGDDQWLEAVSTLADWARAWKAESLVVSLGVDAAASDPESPLEVTPGGYRRAGELLGDLGLPTVIVQEGGYDLSSIGELVREALLGFEAA
jgi:acetoin utilization deacetylase AcuC-like enzyme